MTLKFNKRLSITPISGGDTPTPVEEDWFTFNCVKDDNDTLCGYLRPTKRARKEMLVTMTGLGPSEWNNVEIIDGDVYNVDIPIQFENNMWINKYDDWCHGADFGWVEFRWNSTVGKSCNYGYLTNSWGNIDLNAQHATICVNFYNEEIAITSEDMSEIDYYIKWTCDVTWNQDGTINLTNFQLYKN